MVAIPVAILRRVERRELLISSSRARSIAEALGVGSGPPFARLLSAALLVLPGYHFVHYLIECPEFSCVANACIYCLWLFLRSVFKPFLLPNFLLSLLNHHIKSRIIVILLTRMRRSYLISKFNSPLGRFMNIIIEVLALPLHIAPLSLSISETLVEMSSLLVLAFHTPVHIQDSALGFRLMVSDTGLLLC